MSSCAVLIIMFPVFLSLLLFFVNPNITNKVEQRVTIKFMCKSGRSPIKTWRSLKDVWGDQTLSKTQVRFWHKKFKEGDEGVCDAARPGRPRSQRTQENIDMVSGLITGDPQLSLKDMSSITGISTHTLRTILKKDLKLRCKCAKFILKELSNAQKWTRMTVCKDNLDRLCKEADTEAFMQRIITGDETWLSTHELETKGTTSAWVPPDTRPKKALQSRYLRKTMMTVFLTVRAWS